VKLAAAVLILCLLSGGALAAGFMLPREPKIDIGDGPAYAFPDLGAFLAQQEKLELAINPQTLGSIDMTDTTTLPTGKVVHAAGARWTLTCTYLEYQETRIADSNGYVLWPDLHWGVYILKQDTVGLRQIVDGTKWDFGFVPGYPKRLVVCSLELNEYMITRDSKARDAGVDVGLTEDFAGNPIVGAPDIGAFEWQPGMP
jgi:hypothetical protein